MLSYVFFVFFFTKQEESSARFTTELLAKWLPGLTSVQLAQWVYFIRKTGHILAYGVLTLLAHYAARRTKGTKNYALPLAVIFALLVAVLDERYQMRLPHRTGTSYDVYIDGIGIGIAAVGIWLSVRKKKKDMEVRKDVEDQSS